MAAKAWSLQQKPVDEILFQNHAVSLCLLVGRRAKTMRIVDFRAGATPEKRRLVLELARREGVEKVYTLVERDEIATWVRLGFMKEASIPGFYKRSDAYMLGCTVGSPLAAPFESEVRIAIDSDGTPEDLAPVDPTAHDFAEKTLAQAKRLAKDLQGGALPAVKVSDLRDAEVKKPVAAAIKSGRALTAFEPFGRDGIRRYFSLSVRGGAEIVASTESQACFGNAFLELLTGPRTEAERVATVAALGALCDRLLNEGVVSCFSLSPSDDLKLVTAHVCNGFRRTGLLLSHLVASGARKDAIVWSRKLAGTADD